MYYKHIKSKQNRWSHFWENRNFNFFLMWTTLNFWVSSKTKKTGIRYLRGHSRYRIWTRLVSWFRRYVTWQTENLKTIFLVSRIFLGKADSVILLGFECTINTQNLKKIVRAIFEKIEILNFFLMWTTLNFGGSPKTERTGRRYSQWDSRYQIWTRLVSWFKCYFSWQIEN